MDTMESFSAPQQHREPGPDLHQERACLSTQANPNSVDFSHRTQGVLSIAAAVILWSMPFFMALSNCSSFFMLLRLCRGYDVSVRNPSLKPGVEKTGGCLALQMLVLI